MSQQENKRFGQPEFIGEWEGSQTRGKFEMHVLKRRPDFPRDTQSKDQQPDAIEGIILDDVGIAVFSGSQTEETIVFEKTYSRLARARGGLSDLVYEGEREKDTTTYKGKYSVRGTQLSGEFILRETKSSLHEE